MPVTLHMVPADDWEARAAGPWRAPSLAIEGFIHCTDGYANLAATGNRHYAGDPRRFLILTVQLDRLASPWRYDDGAYMYPHIYGPIDEAAVVAVQDFPRAADGTFLEASAAPQARQ